MYLISGTLCWRASSLQHQLRQTAAAAAAAGGGGGGGGFADEGASARIARIAPATPFGVTAAGHAAGSGTAGAAGDGSQAAGDAALESLAKNLTALGESEKSGRPFSVFELLFSSSKIMIIICQDRLEKNLQERNRSERK